MYRKRIIIIAAVIVLITALVGGVLMLFMKTENRDLYNTDHKFRKDITLEELRSVKEKHGPLVRVEFYTGGGMEGGSEGITLFYDREGNALIETSRASEHSFPLAVRTYSADPDSFVILKKLAEKDNLPVWKDLPFDDEYIELDGPSSSLRLIFDDSGIGGNMRVSCNISYENVMPEGGGAILRNFTDTLSSYIRPENLKDAYLLYNGKRINTGRNAGSTDDEIGTIVSGYWLSENGEMFLYNYGLGEDLEFRKKAGSGWEDAVFAVKEIVHSPYEDADCSWHAVLEDDRGHPWIMYAGAAQLVLKRTDGKETVIMNREG